MIQRGIWTLLLVWAAMSAYRVNVIWRSDVELWSEATRINPCAVRPWLQLAQAAATMKDSDLLMKAWEGSEAAARKAGPCAR